MIRGVRVRAIEDRIGMAFDRKAKRAALHVVVRCRGPRPKSPRRFQLAFLPLRAGPRVWPLRPSVGVLRLLRAGVQGLPQSYG